MSVGNLKEFKIGENNWATYISRIKQYFKANSVKSDLYASILLTVVEDEAFEPMTDLCNPVKPEDMTFEELVKTMTKHLQPEPSEIAERYKFRQRKQEAGESIATYIAALKKISKIL